MGYITIRNTGIDKLTIDNSFSTVAVVNFTTREVRSISVEDLLEHIRSAGARSDLPHMPVKASKRAM